ncbi:MAG: LPS export ABC transporter ATP-binding protein [Armatimonadetes bacterium]|nr:LPS export ABC transporter ATP-binding protein [Armatimonadota bacterium]
MELSTDHLVKRYKHRTVVNGVSLTVKQGEIVGLLGKNGAGKTTTFYMVVGLVRPAAGRVLLNGHDITTMPMYRRAREGVGYLAQENSVFRKLTVEENLRLVLQMQKISKKEQEYRIDSLLDELSLDRVRKQVAMTLSGGERRRVEIARTLATQPAFVLLDEPFTGVDPIAIHDIQELVRHLKDRNIGVLITDHNVRETLAITDRSYIINEGRILTHGDPQHIIHDPQARQYYLGERFVM